MTEKIIECWHFLPPDHRLGYDDGRLVVPGETLSVEPPIALCERGLHGSRRALDALAYAPGPHISRVVLSGEVKEEDDKAVATHRHTLWIADADAVLSEFARWCALQVVHLWDAPAVVVEFLETGDETLRDAAKAAASAAARAAGWDTARAAAWDTARAAARYVARDKQNQKLEEMLWQLKN